MITGWGANSRLTEIHYFRESDGFPLCATETKRKSRATLPLPKWNPENPNTCPLCKAFLEKITAGKELAGIGKTSISGAK